MENACLYSTVVVLKGFHRHPPLQGFQRYKIKRLISFVIINEHNTNVN